MCPALSFGQGLSGAPVSLRQKAQLQRCTALELLTRGLQVEAARTLARTEPEPLLSLPCAGELARREGARDASPSSPECTVCGVSAPKRALARGVGTARCSAAAVRLRAGLCRNSYADRHTLSEPLARLEPLEHACCLLVLNIVPVHKRSRVQR